MKGKPCLEGEAGGLGQFRIQQREKTHHVCSRESPSYTFPCSWVTSRPRGWHTWNGPGRTWKSQNSLPLSSLETEPSTWRLRSWLEPTEWSQGNTYSKRASRQGEGTPDVPHLSDISPATQSVSSSPQSVRMDTQGRGAKTLVFPY